METRKRVLLCLSFLVAARTAIAQDSQEFLPEDLLTYNIIECAFPKYEEVAACVEEHPSLVPITHEDHPCATQVEEASLLTQHCIRTKCFHIASREECEDVEDAADLIVDHDLNALKDHPDFINELKGEYDACSKKLIPDVYCKRIIEAYEALNQLPVAY